MIDFPGKESSLDRTLHVDESHFLSVVNIPIFFLVAFEAVLLRIFVVFLFFAFVGCISVHDISSSALLSVIMLFVGDCPAEKGFILFNFSG